MRQAKRRGDARCRSPLNAANADHCSSYCPAVRHRCSRYRLRVLSLHDKMVTARALMNAGAAIAELNCVRKHLSAIKGGRLAAAAAGRTVTLAISDVHGPDCGRSSSHRFRSDRRRSDDLTMTRSTSSGRWASEICCPNQSLRI